MKHFLIVLLCLCMMGCGLIKQAEVKKPVQENNTRTSENKNESTTNESIPTITNEIPNIISDLIKQFAPIKDPKIVAIGDSLTQGVGDEANTGGYVGLVKQQLENLDYIDTVTVHNFGIRGLRSEYLVGVMNKHTETIADADVIFLTIGGNDMVKSIQSNVFNLTTDVFDTEKPKFLDRMKTIIETIREKNKTATIVFTGLYNPFSLAFDEIPEIDTLLMGWNEAEKQLILSYENTVYVDVFDLFANRDDLLSDDHFHPNHAGYALMTNRIMEMLETEKNNIVEKKIK